MVNAEYIDSDGNLTGLARGQATIPEFTGFCPIIDLNAFPFQYHPKYEILRCDLIARGERSLKLRGRHLQEYQGHALDQEQKKFNVSLKL